MVPEVSPRRQYAARPEVPTTVPEYPVVGAGQAAAAGETPGNAASRSASDAPRMSLRAFISLYFDSQSRLLEDQSKRFGPSLRRSSSMTSRAIIALVDGDHHPAFVRD